VGRRTLTLVLGALGALALAHDAAAGSVADFTLGLSGEYLSETQEIQSRTTERSSLAAAIALAVDGHILDPRFLTYHALVRRDARDLSSSDGPDSDLDTMLYSAGVRAFSNRMVSFELFASRTRHDVLGFAGSAAVAGTAQRRGASLRFAPGRLLDLRLSQQTNEFHADDPSTLRDETRDRSRLAAVSDMGPVKARLDARRSDYDLFSGALHQVLDTATLDVAADLGARFSLHSLASWNRTAVSTRAIGDQIPTTVLVTQSWLQRRTVRNGFWRLGVTTQDSDHGAGTMTADQAYVTVVEPVSEAVQVDVEASYLRADDDLGARDAPSLALGLRYELPRDAWVFSFHPRAIYTQVSGEEIATESVWGGSLVLLARRMSTAGELGFEVDRADNRYSVGTVDSDPSLPSQSFLAGIERAHTRGRAYLERRLLRRSRIRLDVTAEERIRVLRGLELTDARLRGDLTIGIGSLQLRAAVSHVEVTGDEFPSRVQVAQIGAVWSPTHWLSFDAYAYREERRTSGVSGELRWQEAGVRLVYAQLSFFARYRLDRSLGASPNGRRSSRLWIGVARTFDWRLGSNGARRHRSVYPSGPPGGGW